MLLVAPDRQISALVRGKRLKAGWTQAYVAQQLGVSRKWLSGIERGRVEIAEFGAVIKLLTFLGYRIDIGDTTHSDDSATTTGTASPSQPDVHNLDLEAILARSLHDRD